VFQYPLQKNQLYVKRIAGLPNDRLHIAGGNLYLVEDAGGTRTYEVLRKPDDLQEEMWKNVYPARRMLRESKQALGDLFAGSPSRVFTEDAGSFTAALDGGSAKLWYRDGDDGGFVDRVWDGYPEATAREIRDKTVRDRPQEIVPDARLTVTVTPSPGLDEFALEVEVQRPGFDMLTFALVAKGGKGRFQVRTQDTKVAAESPEFDFALPANEATEVAFAHVDDTLRAWHDGDEVTPFFTDDWAVRQNCEVRSGMAKPEHRAVPQIVMKGKGKVRLEGLRLDRDQHYTRAGAPEVIEVPADHYFMMGDNTLQSIDSRDWTAIRIGVDDQNRVVPPDTAGARVVRGNKRAMDLSQEPDRDETPIAFPSKDCIVMIDEYGEILRLDAKIAPDWGQGRVSFQAWDSQDGRNDWSPPEEKVAFVPRDDIQGRALLVFYPARPLSWLFGSNWPNRFGFVR
jgi:hypothetical protein